jgi:hypothetical protein
MLNSGNNDREQNWLLLSPSVKRAKSDWRATVTLGCPRCGTATLVPKMICPDDNAMMCFDNLTVKVFRMLSRMKNPSHLRMDNLICRYEASTYSMGSIILIGSLTYTLCD